MDKFFILVILGGKLWEPEDMDEFYAVRDLSPNETLKYHFGFIEKARYRKITFLLKKKLYFHVLYHFQLVHGGRGEMLIIQVAIVIVRA